ncbi:hypothetical protein AGMMS50229_13430 [Campylobacterota bacterium]|nr:hypothetical protein AGMMS50229_13430 [Campylobacterota bacterium]
MADTDAQIVDLFTAAGEIAEKYKDEQRDKDEDFNIFSILRAERKEAAHSYFLYELLRNDGNHNHGDLFLELFLKNIEFDEETAELECEREEWISGGKRRIDFVIEDENNIIFIEMKVGAKDSENQLNDYYKHGEKYAKESGQTPRYYYLTPNGDPPVNASKEVEKAFTPISFDTHIRAFIQKAIEACDDGENIRLSLEQYLNVVNNITGQISKKEEEIMEIMELIKDNKAAMMGALEICRFLPDILAEKELEFWNGVADKIINIDIERYKRDVYLHKFNTDLERKEMLKKVKEEQVYVNGYSGLFFFKYIIEIGRYIDLFFHVHRQTNLRINAMCTIQKAINA